ncbi:hypothetical protein MMC18_007907 [Xylographa bjoerkii]|nr:hypothetical protein [Xylographa bjoerkii]
MASTGHVEEPKNFAPKNPPKLDAPKSDPITVEELAKCDGADESKPTLVAIKGTVFDVTGNASYAAKGPYRGMRPRLPIFSISEMLHSFCYHRMSLPPALLRSALAHKHESTFEESHADLKCVMTDTVFIVFAGKDASRALAMSSVKPEDCRPDWEDLPDKEKTVLDEWMTFFSKRYNIVGKVVS